MLLTLLPLSQESGQGNSPQEFNFNADEINCLDLNASGTLLASADDMGQVLSCESMEMHTGREIETMQISESLSLLTLQVQNDLHSGVHYKCALIIINSSLLRQFAAFRDNLVA